MIYVIAWHVYRLHIFTIQAPVDMRIDVPAPFTALTSGILVSMSHDMEGNRTTYDFYQPMPIAAQQLSLTMGVFERWNISQRITVWMEPGRMVSQSASSVVKRVLALWKV